MTLSAALEQLAEQRAQVASLLGQLRSSRQQHVHGMAALEAEEEAISNRLTHRLAKARETVAALARDSESETEVRAAGNKKCGAARERSSSARPTRRRHAPPRSPAGVGTAPAEGKERAGSGKRGAARARGGADGGKNVCGGGGLV